VLDSLALYNYRNLNLELTLDQANLVIAPNSSGKSNMLEAIYLASFGKVFRPIEHYQEVIGPLDSFTKVTLKDKSDTLEVVISKGEKLSRRFLLNGKQRSLTEVIGRFPVILFAPHVVDLVAGEPSIRRNDLDDYLSALDKNYAIHVRKYQQLLKNRNALLKDMREHGVRQDELKFWTDELVKSAVQIVKGRSSFFAHVDEFIKTTAIKIYKYDEPEFHINYLPDLEADMDSYASALTQKFADNQQKEVIVGQTLYGPHKDDYQLLLNGENLRFLGSRGQQRISVLVWKLAQWHYLKAVSGVESLILIDDIMSELDQTHRERISNYLLEAGYQFILTGAEKSDIPESLQSSAQNLKLR
jgi:DNA replication and repair protein RecF